MFLKLHWSYHIFCWWTFFFLAVCFGVRILPQQFLHLKGLEPYWSSECLGIPYTYTCHWNIAYTTRKPTTAVWAIQILDGKIIYRLINGRGSFIARFHLQQIGALEKKKFSWYDHFEKDIAMALTIWMSVGRYLLLRKESSTSSVIQRGWKIQEKKFQWFKGKLKLEPPHISSEKKKCSCRCSIKPAYLFTLW